MLECGPTWRSAPGKRAIDKIVVIHAQNPGGRDPLIGGAGLNDCPTRSAWMRVVSAEETDITISAYTVAEGRLLMLRGLTSRTTFR